MRINGGMHLITSFFTSQGFGGLAVIAPVFMYFGQTVHRGDQGDNAAHDGTAKIAVDIDKLQIRSRKGEQRQQCGKHSFRAF